MACRSIIAGKAVDAMVSNVDPAATILDIAGAAPPTTFAIDGLSLAPSPRTRLPSRAEPCCSRPARPERAVRAICGTRPSARNSTTRTSTRSNSTPNTTTRLTQPSRTSSPTGCTCCTAARAPTAGDFDDRMGFGDEAGGRSTMICLLSNRPEPRVSKSSHNSSFLQVSNFETTSKKVVAVPGPQGGGGPPTHTSFLQKSQNC